MRAAALLITAVLLAGCGGGSHAVAGPQGSKATPGQGSGGTGPAAVIRGWADALRGGDLDKASRYFALPTLVANGTPPIELRSRSAVRVFNATLPCGARYLRSIPHHGYVIAEFRLTDRTGAGAVRPCTGKGGKADVAFRIAHGRISEWRRAAAYPGETPSSAPPSGNNFT